jgi:glutamine synthetase
MAQPEVERATELTIDDRRVTTVRILYPDLHGIARGKDVPLGEFPRIAKQGLGFCSAVMANDLRHTTVLGGEAGFPDMVAMPDLDTLLALPWEPDVACCLADLGPAPDGAPPPDPRGLVRNAVAQCEELGYAPQIGPELEFFLLEPDSSAPGSVRRLVDRLSMAYTVGPQVDPQGTVRRLTEQLASIGFGTFAANHEYMNSQYEINLHHGAALDAADRAFRLKAATKDVAALAGLVATFMGKPFNDQGGSGFHLHVSLDRDDGNAFDDGSRPHGMSTVGLQFIAGVLAHARGLMALLNPTINAYRRLTPDSLAPTTANWGWDNRSAFVRVPPERGSATRLEVRIADGAANPYLVVGGILLAGLDGVRRELEPRPPADGDAYRPEVAGELLPQTLEDALDALEADKPLLAAIGPEITEPFIAVKRFEVERHRRHVSEWELDEYLQHL